MSQADNVMTCFGPGSKILTARGNQPVELLKTGDMIWTQHNGMQPIRWIGQTQVAAEGPNAPVVFAPGALNNDCELIVFPEHRMCIHLPHAELLFGEQDLLVAAKHLIDLPGVCVREGGTITYTHFMFDHHEIIYANGQLSESFFYTDASVKVSDPDQAAALRAVFPSLDDGIRAFGKSAGLVLKPNEASVLCYLYAKHGSQHTATPVAPTHYI